MTIDKEFIKEVIGGKIKQKIYRLTDIIELFADIGLNISEFTLRNNLREKSIDPTTLGIDSTRFGYNRSVKFYGEQAVWKYLKKLEKEGKIDLDALAIKNFDDVLKRKSTMKDIYIKGRIIRKPILDN